MSRITASATSFYHRGDGLGKPGNLAEPPLLDSSWLESRMTFGMEQLRACRTVKEMSHRFESAHSSAVARRSSP